VKEGKLKPIWNLRKGDQLQDFFDLFKQMHIALRQREEAELTTLKQVIETTEAQLVAPYRDGGPQMDQPLASLRELRDEKEARLTGPEDA